MSRLLRIEDWSKVAQEANFQPANMAVLCSVSLRQLERFFSVRFGKTPGEWNRELRCRHALKLITEGYSNKAVVAELKFANDSHLCHEFKRVYGSSPQSFPGTVKMSF